MLRNSTLSPDIRPLGLETSIDQSAAAEILQVKTRTLEKWRRLGTGPRFFRIGIRPRYRLIDLIEWQRSRLQRSTLEDGYTLGGGR